MPLHHPARPAGFATHRRALLAALAGTGWLVPLAGCGRRAPPSQAVPPGATVLALGDSLTSGVGASAETAYPAVLRRLTGWNVVNGGVSGDTSAQALERLPALLQAHRPVLVIVGIGGNDFLRRQSGSATRANIARICTEARGSGAQVLLVAVPEFSLLAASAGLLSDHAMYAELARELQIPLHSGGWSTVLADARLRADPIHANAAGYAQFAQGLVETLQRMGLLAR